MFCSVSRKMGRSATAVNVRKAGMALIVRLLHRLVKISPARTELRAGTPQRDLSVSALQGSAALTVRMR